MMNINKYIWMLVTVVAIAMVSCKEDDTEISTITSFDKFSATWPAPIVVDEADTSYFITFTFDDKQIFDVDVAVSVASASTATEGVDFDLGAHEVSVTALARSGTIEIIVHADFEPEGDETVVLHIVGTGLQGLPLASEALVLTIRNSIFPASINLNWEGEYSDSTGTHSLCDGIDIDLFLADDQGNFVGGFGGATANCPESMIADLPDGTYSIVANFYDNGVLGSPGLIDSPITMEVKMFKGGVILEPNSTIKYNTGDFNQVPLWTTFTPSDPNGDALAVVGTIRVSGGAVTLVNPAGADVGTL